MVVHRIDQGELPGRKVGTHHRIRISELLAFQTREIAQAEALAEFGESIDELDAMTGGFGRGGTARRLRRHGRQGRSREPAHERSVDDPGLMQPPSRVAGRDNIERQGDEGDLRGRKTAKAMTGQQCRAARLARRSVERRGQPELQGRHPVREHHTSSQQAMCQA